MFGWGGAEALSRASILAWSASRTSEPPLFVVKSKGKSRTRGGPSGVRVKIALKFNRVSPRLILSHKSG